MTIINTTFITSHPVENDVLDWIRSTYIKSARRADHIPYPHMLAHVDDTSDPDSSVYAVHITFPDRDSAHDWDYKFGMRLRQIAQQRWGEKALSFITYLDVIE